MTDSQPDTLLPIPARRVLVQLLKTGVLDDSSADYPALLTHENAIRSQLANLFLQLNIDRAANIAFILREDNEHPDSLQLITNKNFTFYDTIILIALRRYHQEREEAGERRISIDLERLNVQISPYLPDSEKQSQNLRKISSSLEKFRAHKILNNSRGETDRWEISPLIRHIVNTEQLAALAEQYRRHAQTLNPTDHQEETQP